MRCVSRKAFCEFVSMYVGFFTIFLEFYGMDATQNVQIKSCECQSTEHTLEDRA